MAEGGARMVGPGVVSLSRENRNLVQGGGVKGPLKHKGNFQALPHQTLNLILGIRASALPL